MIDLHCHTDYSNIRLIDAISTVEELIQTASDLKKRGVSLTEHECISSHSKGIQTLRRLKKEGKVDKDFQLILGNEIYLCSSEEEVKDNYKPGVTKFPHFLLLAKDSIGHLALRKLSTKAWQNSFRTGIMERVPTYKKDLEETVRKYPNRLIASSACLGSESSIHILNGEYDKAKNFLKWCSDLFGKDHFYLELQPSKSDEQRKVNEWLVKFSKELDLDMIITSDVHYLRPEDADIHEAFLNSKDAEREIKSFYESCFLHTNEEIYSKMDYLDKDIISKAIANTLKIGSMVEDYTLEAPTIIPKVKIPEFKVKHIFKPAYDKYSYIEKMANSKDEQDRYLLHQIEEGFQEFIQKPGLTKEYFHKVLNRINVELEELWEISVELNQSMASYYVTVQDIVKTMWADECGDKSREIGGVVGSGRGSASGFLINYLLKITMINPLNYGVEMPHWRHLHKSRGDISALDIDLDLPPEKRAKLFERMKERYGDSKVTQVCTFGTEKTKSAIQTACRGLGYEKEVGQYISSLVPFSRGENYSIKECLEGDVEKDRKPVPEFIKEIRKYPKLEETALRLEGLINKRSIHAGGILLTNRSIVESNNALMTAPNGTMITQLNLDDSQAGGSIKYDLLGVSNISKLQLSLEILLDEGLIEWQGNLRKTFYKYFHPDSIDVNKPEYYKLLGEGEIPDLFQFDTGLAINALTTAKPSNLVEMAAVNSLMRLLGDGKETPVETFTKYKNDISLWYDEMKEYNLNEEEISVMEEYLLPVSGVGETQEVAMLLSQDNRIAGFDVATSNKLRKAIAKKSDVAYEGARKEFYESGLALGNREEILNYVWNVQINRQRNYSFSILHTIAYSIIGLQNIMVVADYSPIVWYTACLSVNSGSLEVEDGVKSKTTDYGKISSALADLRTYGVRIELPLINSAGFSFTPDIKNNRIIFSLKGITTINDDTVHSIIQNRPYTSYDDFNERMYKTKLIQRNQMLNLIKAGCFNEFDTQMNIMKKFVVSEVPVKKKLNGQNMAKVISYGLLDSDEWVKYKKIFQFRTKLKKQVHKKIDSPKNKILFVKDEMEKSFFDSVFGNSLVTDYATNGSYLIDEKVFDAKYKALMQPVMDLLETEEFVSKFNNTQFIEIWNESVKSNSIPAWQMKAVSFYESNHELEHVKESAYGIVNFFNLNPEPIVTDEFEWKGRQMKNFQLFNIAGTVLDKNKNNHTVTILTKEGVVTCKMWGGMFSSHDKQIKKDGKIESKSWFSRGNLLYLKGFRRENQFVLKAPKGESAINLITNVNKEGLIGLQSTRNG